MLTNHPFIPAQLLRTFGSTLWVLNSAWIILGILSWNLAIVIFLCFRNLLWDGKFSFFCKNFLCNFIVLRKWKILNLSYLNFKQFFLFIIEWMCFDVVLIIVFSCLSFKYRFVHRNFVYRNIKNWITEYESVSFRIN